MVTAYNVFKHFASSGDVTPNGIRDRVDLRRLTKDEDLFVVGLVLENPCLYLREICKQVEEISGLSVSGPTICCLLRRYGLTRKRIQKVALKRQLEYRADFMAEILHYPREQLVWIDEMGCDRRDAMRQYGYAIRGETPIYHRLEVRGQRVSAIAAISSDGMVATEFKKGSVNSDDFCDFVRGSLIPNMHSYDGAAPKSVAIMDNCSIHHVSAALELFASAGIMVISLPPYSPDFNPIELGVHLKCKEPRGSENVRADSGRGENRNCAIRIRHCERSEDRSVIA